MPFNLFKRLMPHEEAFTPALLRAGAVHRAERPTS
jgi:hypothetical protein